MARGHGQRSRGPGGRKDGDVALDIFRSFSEPMLRWGDVPGSGMLAEQLMLHPQDPYLRDVYQCAAQDQVRRAEASGDPFYGNPPPLGTLPPLVLGRIPVCMLHTGEVLSIALDSVTKNMCVVGPTGGGKTNFLRLLIAAVLAAGQGLVVAFDRKPGELVDCQHLNTTGLPLTVLFWNELKLAMLQPAPRMSAMAFCTIMVQLLATQLNLFASRRLLGETLETVFKRHRPLGTWPTLSEWMAAIEAIRVNSISRLGQYREAAIWALKGIHNELGQVVDYAASNMFEQILAQRGCVVVVTSGLSTETESLLASLFINWAYHAREGANPDTLEPLIFVMDDALPLFRGSTAAESEGGINPLSTWAFMGRSRKMGLVVAGHNFGLLSHAFRNNADTTLCFGSYGRDAEELARHMNLTREQAAVLPVIRPGEVVAIARSGWPLAVRGSVPRVE